MDGLGVPTLLQNLLLKERASALLPPPIATSLAEGSGPGVGATVSAGYKTKLPCKLRRPSCGELSGAGASSPKAYWL